MPPISGVTDAVLDLRGLKCPLPALRTRRALKRLSAGETLLVQCTDPLAAIDLPHMLQESGDELLDRAVRDHVLIFRIRKSTRPRA